MTRRNSFARRYWWTVLGGLGVLVYLGYPGYDPRFQECMRTIHVDVISTPGETWEEHSARMDEVAAKACRAWS